VPAVGTPHAAPGPARGRQRPAAGTGQARPRSPPLHTQLLLLATMTLCALTAPTTPRPATGACPAVEHTPSAARGRGTPAPAACP
jgi:hypothetical protein